MNEADVFTEIDITESSSFQQYTGAPTSNGSKKTEDENVVSKPENFQDQNGLSESCSRGRDLSNMTETQNMDTKLSKNDALSLNIEKYEINEIFSESNSEKEFALELTTASESSNCLPEFQFVHHDFSDEDRTTNTKNLEIKLEEFKDLSVTPGNNELKETEGGDNSTEVASSKTQKSKSKKFAILHEDELSDDEKDSADISMVALLRSTISELERALRDSRTLIKTRDEDIASLRREVETGREQTHKEQLKWQKKCAIVEERGREIQQLKKKLLDSEKTVEELSERIKEFESPCSESDDIVACCSSMKELLALKIELVEKDEIIKEIQKNNPKDVLENAIISSQAWKAKERRENLESDQHNQLKLKFLRDAFFYFMIDFHSEEQMKAILAVLSYGDQREDVINQAYRMRQRGKKFTVKEVSSRGLAFLHEES